LIDWFLYWSQASLLPECVHADLETMNICRCCCSNLNHQALQYSL
jgi:hypothetical protein